MMTIMVMLTTQACFILVGGLYIGEQALYAPSLVLYWFYIRLYIRLYIGFMLVFYVGFHIGLYIGGWRPFPFDSAIGATLVLCYV